MEIEMTHDIILEILSSARTSLENHWQYHPEDPGFRNAHGWIKDLISVSRQHSGLLSEMIIALDETLGETNDTSERPS